MHELPAALAGLATYRQFVLWKAVQEGDKINKKPVHPGPGFDEHGVPLQGRTYSAHDPAIWLDAQTAIQKAAELGYGVGFVFTPSDPFFFLDIDKCLQDTNQWSDLALSLCGIFAGCAIEISQSGRGLHIIGTASNVPHACKNIPLGLELYTEGRFVALTGTGAIGDVNFRCDSVFQQVVAGYFQQGAEVDEAEWSAEPVPEWSGPEDDGELIQKMLNSKGGGSVFGNKASVMDLWCANPDALAAAYPDDQGLRAFDNSSADAALCQHLAFWTGKNCERMDRIFRLSGLYRDKWENRPDYRQRTILHAVSHCNAVYGSRKKEQEQIEYEPVSPQPVIYSGEGPEMRSGFQYLAVSQQAELFAGCVYVRDIHRVFTPDGGLLKPEQFKAMYGGYVFALDSMNDKTTKNAWEAFTESQAARFPKSHSICFRPECPPGSLIKEEERVLVNTYVPIKTERRHGDVSPFIKHLNLTLPDERDRAILLSYMAACVQYIGVKFQWAPLLQGAEGNGKTLFTRCVAFAIGSKYTHIPPASEIAEKFNSWLFEKLFIGIEDVYVPEHKREVIEILKPMITNDRLARRAMQQDQIMGDNRANFILNSNHKDAILKTRNDRRFAVFYTAQQHEEDLHRDGMTGSYFPDLYDWLKGGGKWAGNGSGYGYSIVAQYLEDYSIPDELNPATLCHRAPDTSSTTEAIAMSMGGVEQEILEAMDEGRPGFAGGWISSMALDKLLHNRRDNKRITPNKRRDLLRSLGYDLHPGLKDGRVNSVIIQEGGKPRLYIRRGHIYANLTGAKEILKYYNEAQGYQPPSIGDSENLITR